MSTYGPKHAVFACFASALFVPYVSAQIIERTPPPYELVIEAPAGTTVRLDDRALTADPQGRFVVRNPSPGTHVITAAPRDRRCRQSFEQKVAIVAGRSMRVRANTPERTGDLQIFTIPGAQIEVDGKGAGTADSKGELTLRGLSRCGEHKIFAKRDGYDSETRAATVSEDIVSTLTLELRQVPSVGETVVTAAPKYVTHRRLAGPLGTEPMALFHSDGQRLITWAPDDPSVMIWQAETGRQMKTQALGERDSVRVLAASPDLRLVAVTPEKGVVRITDLDSAREISHFRVGKEKLGGPHYVVFSPDGKRLAAVSEDASGVWDVGSGKRITSFPEHPTIGYLRFVGDGRRVISGSTGIALWNAETGQMIRRFSENTDVREGLAVSPDGRWLAAGTRNHADERWQIEVWDTSKGELFRVFSGDYIDGTYPMAFSADSAYLIFAREPQGELRVLEPRSGKQIATWPYKHNGAVWNLAVSQDGNWLVTSTSFGEFAIWRRVP